MIPPADTDLKAFVLAATRSDPGIGILDLRDGRVYLAVASSLTGGDHASLAERELGITDIDAAAELRGFVVGRDASGWTIVNNSGLNPRGNRMEAELFISLEALLKRLLEVPP